MMSAINSKEAVNAILELDNDKLFLIITENSDEFILPCDLPNHIDPFSLDPNIQSKEDWMEYYRICREYKPSRWDLEKSFFKLFNQARKKLARAEPDRILAMHIAKNNLSWCDFYPDDDIAF